MGSRSESRMRVGKIDATRTPWKPSIVETMTTSISGQTAVLSYSVAQVTAYIKSLFTMDPLLGDVWVSGEVSNFKQATSGHCYLTLKDGDACLKSVIWRTAARGITLPRDGDAVLAHGYISVYESQGAY